MRALGYDHVVSMNNFRTPNFPLVADILVWMVERYDPTAAISHDISTPEIRVDFITIVAQVIWTKAGIKLNTKKLYAADGRAVQELLKVALVLYKATQSGRQSAREGAGGDTEPVAAVPKLNDVKAARLLASEITDAGATLYDLLANERELSKKRNAAARFLEALSNNLNSNTEHSLVDKRLHEMLDQSRDEVSEMEKQVSDQESDLKALRVKIKKKSTDLERSDKRLRSLQSVRPAFMDEYEKLEGELVYHYDIYLEHFRNLDVLEHELQGYTNAEKEKMEETERTLKRLQIRMHNEEMTIMRGERNVNDTRFEEEATREEKELVSRTVNNSNAKPGRPRKASPGEGARGAVPGNGNKARGGGGNTKNSSLRADDDDSDISMSDDGSGSESGSSDGSGSDSDDSQDSGDILDDDEDGSDQTDASDGASDDGSDGGSGSDDNF